MKFKFTLDLIPLNCYGIRYNDFYVICAPDTKSSVILSTSIFSEKFWPIDKLRLDYLYTPSIHIINRFLNYNDNCFQVIGPMLLSSVNYRIQPVSISCGQPSG